MIQLDGLTGFDGLVLGDRHRPIEGRIGFMIGTADTAAGIIAELLAYKGPNWEPPVWSRWYSSTDGSIWQHNGAGTTADTWGSGGSGGSGDSCKAGTILSPQSGDVLPIFIAPSAGTLTRWRYLCLSANNLATVIVLLNNLTTNTTIDTKTLTSATGTSVLTATFATGDILALVVSTVTGTPASITASIEF